MTTWGNWSGIPGFPLTFQSKYINANWFPRMPPGFCGEPLGFPGFPVMTRQNCSKFLEIYGFADVILYIPFRNILFAINQSPAPVLEKQLFSRIVSQKQYPGSECAALEKGLFPLNNSWDQQFVGSIKSQPQSVSLGSIGDPFLGKESLFSTGFIRYFDSPGVHLGHLSDNKSEFSTGL